MYYCVQSRYDLFIQLTAFVDTADRMATFDPAPIGHHVTYRWTLTGATFFDVNDVTLTQNFTLQPAVGAVRASATTGVGISDVINTVDMT